jgi:hypothetical protein
MASEESLDPSRPPSTLNKCDHCDHRTKWDYATCPECGEWLKDEDELFA